MHKLRILFLTFLVAVPTPAQAIISTLDLQSRATLTYLGFIKVYEASLYAEHPVTERTVLQTDTSKCLRLEYAVSLDTDDFIEGAETVLNRQHSPQQLAQVRHHIDQLHRQYRDVQSGDNYTLCYDATSGRTTLSLNDQELVEIESPLFAAIYFGIWLGPEDPLDDSVRDRLLSP